MAKLLYQGHGSLRVTSDDGILIYIDPYAGEGYDLPADIILVSHQHGDHNQTGMVAKKDDCIIISQEEALTAGKYNSFSILGIDIEAVPAKNVNHLEDQCVGYIVTVDGKKLYFSGDTSKTDKMSELASYELDYAFLCGDGVYNMGLEEAAECAKLIGAKNNVPIHIKPGALFDRETAEKFDAPNRLIIEPGVEIDL